MIPEPFEFALLALAAFRAWKLIADDRILDRPRDWVLDRVRDDERAVYWGDFLVCPWCAGFWVSGLTYLAWALTLGELPGGAGDLAVALGVWLALSGAVGLLASTLGALTGPEE